MNRPDCYPVPPTPALTGGALPLLDVLTSPVPHGRFDSPLDGRHVLCLHLGSPVPVSWRAGRLERQGVRLHGQFCVVPAGFSTRWTLSQPATSLLLRLAPALQDDAADSMGLRSTSLAPAIHIRDPHIEQIGWMMRREAADGYPGGRLFADSLAAALASRLLVVQTTRQPQAPGALPAWRLRQVDDYIEANLERDLTLAELAAVAGFSVSHFKAMFRQATGTPVHRYVMQRRVARARALLLEGRHSVTDIALATGFSHASHLARWLRR